MSYGISEYIDYLFTAVNNGPYNYDPDDVTDWQLVRFFVSGRWADAVWKMIDTVCNKDTIDGPSPPMTRTVRVESERRAHVVIETHDRLFFDMALCGSRFYDREVTKGQKTRTVRTESDVHDCICEIAEFKRYTIKPKTAKAMLSVFNEHATSIYELQSPEYQAKYYPKGPKLLTRPEEIYQSKRGPEGSIGTTWIKVLPDSWIGAYTLIMREHLRARGITKPSKDLLEYERAMLSESEWIGRYTDHLTAKEWRIVFTGLRIEMKEDRRQEDEKRTPIEISEGWLGLRELANALCIERGLSLRDSTICSHYMVPEEAGMSKVDLRKNLLEGDLKTLGIKQPAFNDIIRRKVSKKGSTITNTDLGRLGETFTHRLLSPAVECWVGPESAGVCDISDKSSGDPTGATWAVNVKLSLEDEVNRSFEVSPEHQVSKSWVLLIMPRLLMMRLYPITGEQMTINSNSGGLCVTPEELAEKLKELIES